MGIHPAAAYLVASRLREINLAETGQKRTCDHDRASELATSLDKVLAADIILVDVVCLEGIGPLGVSRDLDSHRAEKLDEIHYVEDFRDIVYSDRFIGKEYGVQHLQCLILCSLRGDFSGKTVSSFYYKLAHGLVF